MRKKRFLLAISHFLLCFLFISSLFLPVVATETITLNPIADTYIDSDSPSANYGGSIFLHVGYWNLSYTENTEENIYLLFNLTILSTDTFAINSATLELYGYSAGIQTSQIGVYSCSDIQWNEIELTWENAPSFSSEPIDVTAVAFTDIWYSWDVTNEVKNSQEGYMTLVIASTSKAYIHSAGFDSKESYSDNPRLVVEYEDIPEFPSRTILPLFLVATLFGIIIGKKFTD